MKPIIFILILMSFFTCNHQYNDKDRISQEILKMILDSKATYAVRKRDCITNVCKRFGIDALTFTKLQRAESSHDHRKSNKYSGAIGLMGIHPVYWKHLTRVVCNRRYAKRTNYIQVMHFIKANTEMGGIVLSTYLKRHNGDYRESLISYGGWRAKRFKHKTNQRDVYLKKVLGE